MTYFDRRSLREIVHDANRQFSKAILLYGSKFAITETPDEWPQIDYGLSGLADVTLSWPYDTFANNPSQKTYQEATTYATEVDNRLRGARPPGSFNPDAVDKLFEELSSQWLRLAEIHLTNVGTACEKFVQILLEQIVSKDIATKMMDLKARRNLNNRIKTALEILKLSRIKKSVLLNYNPQFVATVERIRNQRIVRMAAQTTQPQHAATHADPSDPAATIPQACPEMDAITSAAEDALTVSWIHYRSDLELFAAHLDNNIIEPCMVAGLETIIFS